MTRAAKGNEVRVVIVGSIGLDTIETPTEKREDLLGGSVSYACAAASFFARPGMVGIVGTDFPARHVTLYRKFGIDLHGLVREPGQTFRWSGIYDADMINRRTLSTELNVFEKFSPELPDAYRDAPFLLLGNIAPGLQLHVLDQIRKPRFVVADTMDLWINIARDALLAVIRKVDMLMLNDGEARLLTGVWNLRECAAKIRAWGPAHVVIKKGEHGAMLFSKDKVFLVPAYPVEAVRDPTGAGDSFAGGFLGRLAQVGRTDARSIRASLLYGSVVASFGVQDFGLARMKSLTRTLIENRATELRNMMRI